MVKGRINRLITISIFCILMAFVFYANCLTVIAVESETTPVSYNSVIEVESYEVEDGYIQPGKDNTIKLTIKNANKHSAAHGLVAVVSSSSGKIYPQYGIDNQFYVGTLEGGATTTIDIPVMVVSGFTDVYVDFTCNLTYEIGGIKTTNSSTMVLPTQNMSAVVINSIDVNTHASINGKSLLSIDYSNNSSENAIDAMLLVDGNVSDSTRIIDLGSVISGKSYTKDCFIVFTEAGEQTIKINLKYTNKDGEHIEHELGSYIVRVDENVDSGVNEKYVSPVLIVAGRILSLLALVIAGIITFAFMKNR